MPAFFGPGSARWQPDDFWTKSKLRQFYVIHGPLLRQLGYASGGEVSEGAYPAGGDEEQLLLQAWRTAQERWQLQQPPASGDGIDESGAECRRH